MQNQVKPNLLVIGAMKASTTLFYDMLRRHPEVWFSDEKEPHYFTDPNFAASGPWQAYLRLFSNCPEGKKIIGEASTGYIKSPHVGPTPQRIRMRLGQPKMIYILSDPVKRVISNFNHSFARGFYQPGYTLGQAIEEDQIIVDASRYDKQLKAYEEEFGEGSVLVIIAEELHKHPARVMAEVEQYLEITPANIWDAPPTAANSIAKVQVSEGWIKLARVPLLRRLKQHAPSWLTDVVRKAVPSKDAPKATEQEESRVFDLLAEDLRRLYQRLGSRIVCWPSMQKLLAETPIEEELVETAA